VALTKVGKEGVTGISNSSNATAITIDTSENVLVGKTAQGTANDGLQVKPAGELAVTRDGNHTLILNRKSSDGDIALLQKDGSTVGKMVYSSATNIAFGNASKGVGIGTGSVFPTNGSTAISDAGLDLGYSSSRFKDLYLSGGAYIGGTVAANKLDDYEEGSWTGTLTGASSAPSTAVTATGSYTKIGRLVTVSITFSAKNTSGASGALQVTGLPFSISDQGWGSYLSYGTANTASSSIEAVAWANSGTAIVFYDWADSGVWNTTTITAGSDRYLFVSITYATS